MIGKQLQPVMNNPAARDTAVPRLTGGWLRVARVGWLVLAVTAVLILIASLPGYALKIGGQLSHGETETRTIGVVIFAALSGVSSLAAALLSLGLAFVFFRRRFAEPAAAALAYFLLIYGVVLAGPLEALSAYWTGDVAQAQTLQGLLLVTPMMALFVLFPNGRFVPAWTRWALILTIPWNITLFFLPGFGDETFTSLPSLQMGLLLAWYASFLLIGLYAQVYRYRRVSTPAERQQTKWVIFGFAIWIAYGILSAWPYFYLLDLPPDTPLPWWAPASELGWFLSLAVIPLTLAIAVTRSRLWQIDIIINRTLVYGALTAVVMGLYALVVGGAGLLFQQESRLVTIPVTAVLVIALFRPLNAFLQRQADRLIGAGERRPIMPITASQSPEHAAAPAARLTGRWLRAAQIGWLLIGLTVAALWGWSVRIWAGGDTHFGNTALDVPYGVLMPIGYFSIAVLLVMRKPDDRMALLTSLMLIFLGPYLLSGANETVNQQPGWDLISRLLLVMGGILFLLFLLTFPDGRFTSGLIQRLWRLLAGIYAFGLLLSPELYGGFSAVYLPPTLLFGIGVQIYRYRRLSSPVQRQQTKWVVVGAVGPVLLVLNWVLLLVPGVYAPPTDPPIFYVYQSGQAALGLLLPIALAFSILRYRLWDIDILISRALVYGALTAVVVGIYMLIVGALGALAQVQGSWPVALLATGLVAVLFQPLRERLQRGVNRLIYGERDDPVAVFSKLGERLATAVAPEEMLPILARTIARTLKLPYVAVTRQTDGAPEIAAAYGKPAADLVHLPLTYQGQTIGELQVAPRQVGESFNPAEMALLQNVARQAGTAVHAAQLTADLRRSRQRLVTMREEERRRLRRDLHDDLGPKLASLTLSLNAIGKLMARDPDTAAALLAELKEQVGTAVQDIRRLVYDLRPPALDDLGLAAALRESAARYRPSSVQFTIHAPQPLPALPAAVEVAAYRIAQEAMTNVVRHAGAAACQVTLALEPGALCLTVADDGCGLPADIQPGIGLRSMQERVAELDGRFAIESQPGGGTTVKAALPLAVNREP